MKIKNNYQFPLNMMLIYLVFTLVLYVIGPIDWVTYSPIYFWSLQILYISMLFLGWQVGINCIYTRKDVWPETKDDLLIKKLNPFLIINFFYEFINTFRRFQFSSFDFSALVKRVIYGFTDMGGAYNSFQETINTITGSSVVGGTVFSLFNYIWEICSFLVLLLATYYYKKLKKGAKFILLLTYAIIIMSYISTGTNIGVFRLVLAWMLFLLMKFIRGEHSVDWKKWKKRKKWIIFILIISIVLCIILFEAIMKSRGGILLWDTSYYNIGGRGIDHNSILFKIFPHSWSMLLVSATGYLTQGYYGMSLCLQTDWIPTFGLGHSMIIEKLLAKYVTDIPHLTIYQHRIEKFGWNEDVQWHTAYSWFANDVSFLGVAFVMLIFGILFAMAYKDSIKTNNPFAHIMVYFFTLAAFFIPCNNQLFQSTYVMFSFITTFIIWICTRGRKIIVFRRKR